ncbi:MAG: DUF5698 domain-containing protein [Ignavibacteriaceae bacterium]|nr:DUF5698 domain-containing protein [Ignavibacteriaceae bacterium]
MNIWLLGSLIFLARIIDVSVGTLRTISIIQGRTKVAFFLAFIETSVWLIVLSEVLPKVVAEPLLGVFYAFGFATGNVVGILVEKRLAMGYINFRVITTKFAKEITNSLREKGFAVTNFEGEGKDGKVTEIYVATDRKNLSILVKIVKEIEPDAFYIAEQAGIISKIRRPTMVPATGWRAVQKKK